MKRALQFLLFVVTLPMTAAEPEIVRKALDAVDRDHREGWAYTMTVVEDGKRRVERFDPSGDGEEWSLLRIEGLPPTKKDLEDYEEITERRRRNGDDDSVRDMIKPGTLRFVSEDQSHVTYAFDVAADNDRERKMMDHVTGTLQIRKEGPYVDRLDLASDEAFKPMTGVKIDSFSMTITYVVVADGPVAPRQMMTKVKGKAFLIKTIDSDVRLTFSDYEFVGE